MTTEAERIACLEAQLEGVKESVEASRSERQAQYKEILAELKAANEKIDHMAHEVSEYRGAIIFGRWLAATLIALGIPTGLLVWLGVPHK